MGKAPAFQLYAKDIYTGTSEMSSAAFGAYCRALCWSWDNGPLPLDSYERRRALLVDESEWDRIWTKIAPLWREGAAGYTNDRLEEQRQTQKDFSDAQSERGKNGAAKRWGAKRNGASNGAGNAQALAQAQPDDGSAICDLQSPTKESKEHSLSPEAKPSDLMAAWNSGTTPPIPKCRELTPSRRKHSIARLREAALDVWVDVIERIEASAFCRGQTDRGGWVATFDWLLQQDTRVKVLEGKYDNRPRGEPGFTAGDKASRTMAAAEHVIALQLAQRKAVGDGT